MSSSPNRLTVVNDKLFFVANNNDFGSELWVSDGTLNGTNLVKDINPGSESSNPLNLTVVNDKLFFIANNNDFGSELWISDGTQDGTNLVKDINPGNISSSPNNLTVVNDKLFFTANNGENGSELWITDGTENGTNLVKDINPGNISSSPNRLTVVNDKLFFTANNGENGSELWVSDGTLNGTNLVKDINPNSDNSSNLGNFFVFDDKLFFVNINDQNQIELWASDGTSQGTHLIEDIGNISNDPRFSSTLAAYEFTILNDTLFFLAENENGYQLWQVESENNLLIANDDKLTIFTDETINLTADLLSNDSGDDLEIIEVGKPSNGIVSLDSSGDIFFAASEDFIGDATFTYTVGDRNGVIDSAIVNLTVQQSDFTTLAEDKSILGIATNIFPEDTGISSNFAENSLMAIQENNFGFIHS
ncbi:MAG: ELWxxDGT repeat protein [Rivularia sp. (in: cyanobacteria)]